MVRLVVLSAFALGAAADDYSHDLARRLVQYAGATYCTGSKSIDDWSCVPCQAVPGFQHITQIQGHLTDATAIIGFDPTLGARIVAFMGTNANIETWIDDVLLAPTKCYVSECNGCYCHPGFKKAYYSIASQVLSAVQNLPSGKLIITGHSLGAAQATHCAIHLHNNGLAIDHIYTMGQPRVGNKVFASWYDSLGFDHWRVNHHRDPVPHLPWRGLGNYKHILREAYYEKADAGAPTKICNAGDAEDKTCADQFNDELTLPFITDHWYYLGFNFAAGVLRCTFSDEVLV